MEVVIFDQDWLDIPIQDYPIGGLCVCHDPQHRLGRPTWAVLHVTTDYGPPDALGLFWKKDEAVLYAEAKGKE
jgi:hypothetical protein